MRDGGKPRLFTDRRLLALSAGNFTVGAGAYIVTGILPQMAADMGGSVAALGQTVTAFAVAVGVGAPLLAGPTSSIDRKRLLSFGLLLFAAGQIASCARIRLRDTHRGPICLGARRCAVQSARFGRSGAAHGSRGSGKGRQHGVRRIYRRDSIWRAHRNDAGRRSGLARHARFDWRACAVGARCRAQMHAHRSVRSAHRWPGVAPDSSPRHYCWSSCW